MKKLKWCGWFILAWLALIFVWAPLVTIANIGKIFCWLSNKVATALQEVFTELKEELREEAE